MVTPIVIYGSKKLRTVSEEVRGVGRKVRRLLDDMTETMYRDRGIGLAAIQIGVPLRVLTLNPTGEKDDLFCVVNPVVESLSGSAVMQEGCLSVPGIFSEVKRPEKAVVSGLDKAGRPFRQEISGIQCRILLHELDHLNGKLFIDRIPLVKKIWLYPRLRNIKKNGAAGESENPGSPL